MKASADAVAATVIVANAALPKAGGALTGAVTTTSTFDGRDVAADGVTADAALPKAGGTMTGDLTVTNATATGVLSDPSGNVRAGRKNLIFNGGMQVSQRGTYTSATAVTNGAYLLDRAKNYLVSVSGTAQQLTDQVVNSVYVNTFKYVSTSAASGRIGLYQIVEEIHKGQEITLSAWVKSNSTDARLVIYDGVSNTSSTTHTGGGAWEKLTVTATQSTSAVQLNCYCVIASSTVGSVSIAASDYIEIAQVQLELGSAATDFEHRSYGEELALCQRFYQRRLNDSGATQNIFLVQTTDTNAKSVSFILPVQMRIAPTTVGSLTLASGATSLSYVSSSSGVAIQSSGTSASGVIQAYATNNSEWLTLDAEL
tara:strand:- start:202 stop:1311 length:1110 start_codon:yes stop_codon:yes gene_type:complete